MVESHHVLSFSLFPLFSKNNVVHDELRLLLHGFFRGHLQLRLSKGPSSRSSTSTPAIVAAAAYVFATVSKHDAPSPASVTHRSSLPGSAHVSSTRRVLESEGSSVARRFARCTSHGFVFSRSGMGIGVVGIKGCFFLTLRPV